MTLEFGTWLAIVSLALSLLLWGFDKIIEFLLWKSKTTKYEGFIACVRLVGGAMYFAAAVFLLYEIGVV